MFCSQTCTECNRRIRLEFDETDGTVIFCPFCGEELGDDPLSSYEDAPGIKGADADDAWVDDEFDR